jgi:hypothetical protein
MDGLVMAPVVQTRVFPRRVRGSLQHATARALKCTACAPAADIRAVGWLYPRLLLADESRLLPADESRFLPADESRLLHADESRLLSTDESRLLSDDESRLLSADESCLLLECVN